jgi:hypothetical protein
MSGDKSSQVQRDPKLHPLAKSLIFRFVASYTAWQSYEVVRKISETKEKKEICAR